MTASSAIETAGYRALKLVKSEGILTITLSNPGKRNAATPEMGSELQRIWSDAWRDSDVKVIVLTGEGEDFCSGVDLGRLDASRGPTPDLARVPTSARDHVLNILRCEKPVIAKVRGAAYGMGVNMALACDMVYVSETARLCDSHVKIGLVAGDGGVLLWPQLCGMLRAKRYLMTGDPIDGRTAECIGLATHCLPDHELDAAVHAMAVKLRDLPPLAVNFTKVALNAALRQATETAFESSLAYEVFTMTTEDHKEAVSAFLEKRKPQYKGK